MPITIVDWGIDVEDSSSEMLFLWELGILTKNNWEFTRIITFKTFAIYLKYLKICAVGCK